jgi:predicted DNA-binding transcriptional regulator YafY
MARSAFPDTIRKIELLARILNQEQISKSKVIEEYSIKEVTVNRMLQFYRSIGIEAFGRKNGIKVYNKPNKNVLSKLAAEYLSVKLNSDYFTDSLNIYSKIDSSFFVKIVLITKAVNENLISKIRYRRLSDDILLNYTLKPIRIIESNNNWILHAIKENETILKTFYLSRIEDVKLTNKNFKRISKEETSSKKRKIVLRFVPHVEQELFYKIWFDDFELNKESDGSTIISTDQRIDNRLAAWCISWWDAMQIIEPNELKKYILKMYKDFASVNNL